MVIDTSALLALLFGEPEAPAMATALAADSVRLVGAPTVVEAAAVMLARKGNAGEVALDALFQRAGISVMEMTPAAADAAREGYARFGKGVGSPAVLNYGDCFAYGVAMTLGQPLLFKGVDFSRTDVVAVAY